MSAGFRSPLLYVLGIAQTPYTPPVGFESVALAAIGSNFGRPTTRAVLSGHGGEFRSHAAATGSTGTDRSMAAQVGTPGTERGQPVIGGVK